MRRIYESEALRRDDDHFTPNETDPGGTPEGLRSIDSGAWSRRLVPEWLRRRALSVSVSAPSKGAVGEPVPFDVTMRNRMPFPVTLRTASPVVWTWSIDGVREASRVEREPPERHGSLHFARGERKRFRRRWSGHFQIEADTWEPAEPGEYTLRVAINVADPARGELVDETTIRME